MTIYTGTFIPYEYDSRWDVLHHLEQRALEIKHSLRFIEKDDEHLCVRCPLLGDYLDITGPQEDIDWLHKTLMERGWYK